MFSDPHGLKTLACHPSFSAGSILPAAVAVGCLLTACNHQQAQSSEPSGKTSNGEVTLRIGVPQVTGQDPLRGMQQASSLLSLEGLISTSRDGRVLPRLAEKWGVSPDGLRWTFRLRADAKFHDGTAVDAASVKRSLDESLANLNDRSLAPGLEDIVSIEAATSRDVIVTLRNRSTFFLDDLFMAITKPQQGSPPAGTGSFVVTSSSADQVVMSAFDDYYEGSPQIHRIVWKPYPALRTAWAGMMRGEIDFLYEVSQDAVEFVKGESSVGTYEFLRQYVLGMVFNSRREPFKDKAVRQALNFAVDRQMILGQALKSRGVVAHSPIWPLHWAYDQSVPGYAYDPGRAAAILDTAYGHVENRVTQRRSEIPARLRFKCLLPESFALWERMALLVQKQLFDLGVDMELESLPARGFNDRVGRGDFDAVFLEFIGGPSISRPYTFWHSASPRNFSGYRDPMVDEALDAIRRAPDDETYRSSVRALQQSMIADPPGIFLAWGQTVRAVSRRFQVSSTPNGDILGSMRSWRLADQTGAATN